MGRQRSAAHYNKRNGGRSSNAAHEARDAAYRAALGVEDAGPLPREIGTIRHNRPAGGSTPFG